MTISSTANKIIFSGNGATTSFPFTFPGIVASDILAYYTNSTGTITALVQGSGTTQYQVSLTATIPPNPTGIGGTVTYNPSGVPIASGTTLTIIRTMLLTQTTSLANQGTLYPTVIEQTFDVLEAQIQQIDELLGRAISVAVSDASPADLPPAAQRANKYLSFDSNGNPTASASSPGTTPISSTMAAFVNAASLASARSLLGLGNIAVEAIGSGLQDDGAGTLRVNLEVTTADTTNQTVTSAFHNTQRVATGPITYALPRANTLWNGFGFKIENLQAGGAVTISVNAADTFQNYSSGTSFIIGISTSLEIWTDGAASGTWYYRLLTGKTNVGDAAYVVTPGDRLVTAITALTAPRVWTLPLAASYKSGALLVITDRINGITATNTLAVTCSGADVIVTPGTTISSLTMNTPGATLTLMSNGGTRWIVVSLRMGPNVQRLLSGAAATYTATPGCSRQRVRGKAGGGGGGAQTTNTGTTGVTSSFQVNSTGTAWTCIGGLGGAPGPAGLGGTGGTDGTIGILINRVRGAPGGVGFTNGSAGGGSAGSGGGKGGGNGTTNGNAAVAGAANTGGGGSGGSAAATLIGGGGGGEGEEVEFWVTGMTTATYTVGAGGAGGAAGTVAGATGGSGVWIVEEFFD